ncbi:MAG: GAF domain-containing protein, partial [Nitrospinota bacterium]
IGVLTVLVSYGLATVIVRPVHELRQGVELLQKGDFSRPLSRQGGDEIGDLALSFNQMAAALEEKTTDLERRNRELSVLNEVAATVSQSLHLDTMLNNALDKVLALLHMESGALFLLDRSRQKLLLRTHRGLSPAATTALAALDCGESLAGYVAQTGQPLVTSNLHAESRLARDVIREEGYQVIVNVPLQAKGRVLGVLGLGSRTARQITEQELHLLIAIGNQIGVAIENAQLYENLQRQMEELKDAQRQLIQSEKMAAMGHLVSGVAHELNNPLASVIGFTELLLRREQDRTKSEETLRLIHREAMRATKIVQNLLTFSRRHKPEKRYIDINEVIEKTLELRAYAFRTHHIRVIKHLDPSLPRTMADFHQIQQVILNIFNNAEQAMLEAHGRGTLTLVTQAVTDPQAGESSLPTPCIRITISDDGPGIAEEHLRQIFDPFFTTKEAGKGTGLGLSVSYSIIQEHGGQLYASSSPGQGATFVIELPIQAQEEDLSPAPSSPASSEQVFTHKRVLVVEDEE